MKKLLFSLFCFLFVQSLWAYDVEIDGIYYNIQSSSRSASVTKGVKVYNGVVRIPSQIYIDDEAYIVTEIGEQAFFNCQYLKSVEIPSSVVSIGNMAFYGCVSLSYISMQEGVKNIGQYAFGHCNLSSVILPNSITDIEPRAFQNCFYLLSVVLSNNISIIDSYVFAGCERLSSIQISDNIVAIGECAFLGCERLSSIELPNSLKTIGSMAFSYCSFSSITIPENVVIIDSQAFSYCEDLLSIKLPHSLISIGAEAFYGCKKLSSIELPNSITRLASQLFFNCIALKDVTLPQNITSIPSSLFKGCASLRSITLPSKIRLIEEDAFSNCMALSEIYCQRNFAPFVKVNAFYNVNTAKCKLYVPAGAVSDYADASGWSDFTDISEEGANGQWGVKVAAEAEGRITINNMEMKYLYVSAGSDVVIGIIPNDGYELLQLIVNNQDVTSQVANNIYTIEAIAEAKELTVRFKKSLIHLTISHADNGMVSYPMTPGTSQEVVLHCNQGWKINTVTFNGEDVTSEVTPEGRYTTPVIMKDAKLNVSLQSIETLVSVSSGERLKVKEIGRGTLRIDGASAGSALYVYNASGALIHTVSCIGDVIVLSVPENTAYIIKQNDQTIKIRM